MAIWEGSFEDIDPLSLDAIVQLQLEDSQALAGSAKGKQREGVVTDAQLALEMYAMDLNACRDTLADRKMAQSIAIAVIRDGQIIREAYEQEDQLARDQLAMNPGGKHHESIKTATAHGGHPEVENPWAEEEMLAKVSAIYNEPQDVFGLSHLTLYDSSQTFDDEPRAESSAQGASREANNKPKLAHCVGCGDEKESLM
nr:hypothetical protein CFP56_13372 [Quercus suber]